jgi:GT2 family glycosyltransferase
LTVVATVVIVSWNRVDLLRRCLPAVLAQELDPGDEFQVMVVDNGSRDGTAKMLAREFPGVRVVRNRENLGFARGNNVALRQVTSPFAVLLNNDAVPEPGWLRALLAPFAAPGGEVVGATGSKSLFSGHWEAISLRTSRFRTQSDDRRPLGLRLVSATVNGVDVLSEVLGAVHAIEPGFRWTRPRGTLYLPRPGPGPLVIELGFVAGSGRPPVPLVVHWRDGRSRVTVEDPGVTSLSIKSDAGWPPPPLINNTGGVLLENGAGADRDWCRPDNGSFDEAADLFFGCGNGLAIRTAAGRQAGWFDDALFTYYEDVDLSWRLRSRGWHIRYVPDAVIVHDHSATSGGNPELTAFYIERNRLLTLMVNASARLMLNALADFARTSVALLTDRRRPAAERRRRRRVVASLIRLGPRALAQRRRVGRAATVSRAELERLITPASRWEQRGH